MLVWLRLLKIELQPLYVWVNLLLSLMFKGLTVELYQNLWFLALCFITPRASSFVLKIDEDSRDVLSAAAARYFRKSRRSMCMCALSFKSQSELTCMNRLPPLLPIDSCM
jgi:hypothetical protein